MHVLAQRVQDRVGGDPVVGGAHDPHLQAVGQRDLAVVQAVVLLLVWAVLLINFLVDVAYQLVDPRVRRRAEAA